jgi:hypothetical protein
MKKYNPEYLNELITELKSKDFYTTNDNYINDACLIKCARSYVDGLLDETERCNMQREYPDAEEYYYQIACHCFVAGLIISDFFSKNELNDKTSKKCTRLLLSNDAYVTAGRIANIENLDELEIRQNNLFDLLIASLKPRWDGFFDNDNKDIVAMLLSSILAGSCEDLDRYRYDSDSDD